MMGQTLVLKTSEPSACFPEAERGNKELQRARAEQVMMGLIFMWSFSAEFRI
jgi:hypothetical protein